MNFVSTEFVVFLLVTWGLFLVIAPRYRVPLLTAASYVFYATWSIPFIAVILFTTAIDYAASKSIHTNASLAWRKTIMWLAIGVNLAVLGFFKYFNFFLDSNHQLLAYLGLPNPLPQHLDILLPLGISYYTFEAISYLVDVYRGGKPAPSWWDYSFYIMYFPHLIAGPIVRFNELWPQYSRPLTVPSLQRIAKGAELIVLGYLFKVVVANNAALISDPLYAAPASASVGTTYIGALAFAVQLYFDFLGYTHIARGVSLVFNIELPINFHHPLNATNIANFWQRWQISLSRWLHDYVFVPLGGARRSLPRTMINVFLTLLIAGVWHGAGWTFVVFGAYFGLLVGLYHAFRRVRRSVLGARDRVVTEHPAYRFVMSAVTFACIIIGSVLFRSPDVYTQIVILEHLGRVNELARDVWSSVAAGDPKLVGMAVILMVCLLSGPVVVRIYESIYRPLPYWLKWQTATVAAAACWVFCAKGPTPFIYFQF